MEERTRESMRRQIETLRKMTYLRREPESQSRKTSVGDKSKGVKGDTSAFHGTNKSDVHSDYADLDELCSFDDSSSEDDGVSMRKTKFLEFRVDIDLKNLSFKLGMLFETTIKLKAT
ncbi:unnamed protein product, partial [Ilex paraguariensis]